MIDLPPKRTSFHPRTWPIAVKLAFALVVASLAPMLIVSYYNLQKSVAIASESESERLEQIAASTADRLDQLIKDTRHTISYFSWNKEVIDLVSGPNIKGRELVEDRIAHLLDANDDLELFMVLDRRGQVLASNKTNYHGRILDFRDYFKDAIRGNDYISDLEVGTASNSPGMYLSSPIRDASGHIGGVAVLKMKGSATEHILDKLSGRKNTTFLIDGNGIIIHHPDSGLQYQSLMPLPESLQQRIVEEKRFGIKGNRVSSLDLNDLFDKVMSARTGNVKYVSPVNHETEIAGFVRMTQKPWHVVVSEDEDVYARPLKHLFVNALASVILIGLVFICLAVLFARTFTRPLKMLTGSAEKIEEGDLDSARVNVTTQDEIGRLAQTFNAMIDGIKARQRERDIFGRVVSPEVREKLLKGELTLGGEKLRVSVLFSDIRGFSTMSERMSPHDVVTLLNEYLTEMTAAVRPFGGYVNNFIGDAIIVVFGAPEELEGTEANAVRAALAMKERLASLNKRRRLLEEPLIETGIGISTGRVVAGQIGSLERFMYTVIGDAVNVAARLESMTKEFDGNPILINAATYEGCKDRADDLRIVDQGMQIVKGREEPVHVYAVLAESAAAHRVALHQV